MRAAAESYGGGKMTTQEKFEKITKTLIARKLTITTMESCTSGQIISLITDTEGSSAAVKGAFVTYSNEAKIGQGVPADVIYRSGVYSTETAGAMAEACRKAYHADIGIGVTGTYGNADPNNADSIPGQVYFAISTEKGTKTQRCNIPPQKTRQACKMVTADLIADKLLELLET